jgi:hypothetical protein
MQTGTARFQGERYEMRHGGGCLMLFGFPFLAAGLAVMFSPLWASEPQESAWMAIPFGLLFAAVGAGLMFWRGGLAIDRHGGSIRTWWGILVPWQQKEHRLEDVRAVTLTREVRSSKNSTYTVYPVRMEGTTFQVNVETPRDYQEARRKAEQLAKFLHLPVRDSSTGSIVEREAAHLDENLRQRAQRTGASRQVPPPPVGCRIRHRIGGGEAEFLIPARGFQPAMMLLLIPVLLFSGLAYFFVLRHFLGGAGPFADRWPFVLFAAIFLIVPIFAMAGVIIRHATVEERVAVSPQTLRVETRTRFGSRSTEIPAAELEDLDFGNPDPSRGASIMARGGICARSDRASVVFGSALSQEDQRWLRDIIEYVVTEPTSTPGF